MDYQGLRRIAVLRPAAALTLAATAAIGLSCDDGGRPGAPAEATPAGATARDEAGRPARRPGPITSAHDPKLRPLLEASARWARERGPARRVIDQVYLVPDVATFLEAIADWDEHAYFPILLDDPAWTLPFLRAFRPARIVRVRPREPRPAIAPWAAARLAVSRGWAGPSVPDDRLDDAGAPPARLAPTPPGLVLSDAGSPMLAGAVALAAGRFQPLVRLGPLLAAGGPGPRGGARRFADVLTLDQAEEAARAVEALAAGVAGPHGTLGDRCDFLTLAVDWPYRYRNDDEPPPARGEHAVDDMIGRVPRRGGGEAEGLEASRARWAFAGRLLGGPSASTYRAMGSLFLQPSAAVLWNTYSPDGPWGAYAMNLADVVLESFLRPAPAPWHRAGAAASLAAWHRAFDPAGRFGWVMVNSSGGPDHFQIAGGPGRPEDIPRGVPAVVSMIHSFSAADPTDPATIAGRWLDQGAFVYYGSMNEPYLQAFRPPALAAGLAVRGMPLVAALRQGEHEPYGRPWRLAYLGDPLHRLIPAADDPGRHRAPPTGDDPALVHPGWRAREIAAGDALLIPSGDDEARLDGCLIAAMGALCAGATGDGEAVRRSVLEGIDRAKLPPPLRPTLDELRIDAGLNGGEPDRLLDWLLKVPPAQAGPRVERAIETVATARIFDLSGRGLLGAALDAWESTLRRPWPASSRFPIELTERLAAILDSGSPAQRLLLRDRLAALARDLSEGPARSPLAVALKRLAEAQPR
ncbi:hypothetical protein OJF2_40950 [Aquisphaera giovannonii]|uniref:Uncharacterized protein n=1 Tax=Aquisphaera giovannonii TaxID=406548 RepID=A0A5B9W4Q5_9BACT|nr:hypothetical protein [Aquisphaera giovannonii]QEH35542.1 hypothetical protein OJF2_40950 [Aquisphaera giovannonii]